MILRAEGLHKAYGNLEIIKGVDVEIQEKEMLAIVGPSGAGKSTLLHLLSTLDQPNAGKIFFHNKEITGLSANDLSQFRNKKIGFIFQFHHLLPEFTALENICIPAYIKGQSKNQAEKKAMELLQRMDLQHRANHKPSELSGGEQQRVAIARALINNPEIIFADEPTGNLDSENAQMVNELFISLQKEMGLTFVIVTHNLEMAAKANRIISMKDGQVLNAVS
jgi:lipoprotein-releasing system ATP-binding protein